MEHVSHDIVIAAPRKFSLQSRSPPSQLSRSQENTGIDAIQPIKRSKSQMTSSSSTKLSSSSSSSVSRRHRSPPPPASSSSPIMNKSTFDQSQQQQQQNIMSSSQISETTDDSGDDSKDLSNGMFGKARDRTTFKGVFGKMVGSFSKWWSISCMRLVGWILSVLYRVL